MADRAVNAEVERLILWFPPEQRQRVYDALILLQQAGSQGLHITAWAAALRDITGHPAMPVLRRMIEDFTCCITRIDGTMTYIYAESATPSFDEFEVDPIEEAFVKTSIARTMAALTAMQARATFTRDELRSWLIADGHDLDVVDETTQDLIQNLGVTTNPDGSFAVDTDEPVTNEKTMESFRALLTMPGIRFF